MFVPQDIPGPDEQYWEFGTDSVHIILIPGSSAQWFGMRSNKREFSKSACSPRLRVDFLDIASMAMSANAFQKVIEHRFMRTVTGFGFLPLDSQFWIPGFGFLVNMFLGLDNCLGIP